MRASSSSAFVRWESKTACSGCLPEVSWSCSAHSDKAAPHSEPIDDGETFSMSVASISHTLWQHDYNSDFNKQIQFLFHPVNNSYAAHIHVNTHALKHCAHAHTYAHRSFMCGYCKVSFFKIPNKPCSSGQLFSNRTASLACFQN